MLDCTLCQASNKKYSCQPKAARGLHAPLSWVRGERGGLAKSPLQGTRTLARKRSIQLTKCCDIRPNTVEATTSSLSPLLAGWQDDSPRLVCSCKCLPPLTVNEHAMLRGSLPPSLVSHSTTERSVGENSVSEANGSRAAAALPTASEISSVRNEVSIQRARRKDLFPEGGRGYNFSSGAPDGVGRKNGSTFSFGCTPRKVAFIERTSGCNFSEILPSAVRVPPNSERFALHSVLFRRSGVFAQPRGTRCRSGDFLRRARQ